MDNNVISDLLFPVISISLRAGQKIMEVYRGDFEVDYKEDRSPLTLADRLSHEVIAEGLSGLPVKFPILSEEGKEIPYEERKDWEYFWLVDPLDGTKEFIRKNGEFTVNIALIHKNNPVFGVVYAPAKDLLYYAAVGTGAWKLESASEYLQKESILAHSQKLLLRTNGSRPFTIAGSRAHHSADMDRFIEEKRKVHGEVQFVSAGSALKFCLVAEGSADVYPRFGPTMEWDTAAGQCVVEEAGGAVHDTLFAQRLGYNKENLANAFFIASKNGRG